MPAADGAVRPAGVRDRARAWTRGWRGDVVLYAVSAAVAGGLAAVTIYHGHRVWGLVSLVAYTVAGVATAVLRRRGALTERRRGLVAAGAFAASALVPLVILVAQRGRGVPWSAQPEVGVVERMAALLLRTGTPYLDVGLVDRPLHFEDFTPYLPAMSLFGVPRAALGDSPLTDARVVFLACAALLLVLAARLLARPVPVRAAQFVAVVPATTLTVATGGDDLPVLGLLVLCVVACHRGGSGRDAGTALDPGVRRVALDPGVRRVALGAAAGGAALAMKLTAAPVLVVLAVFLWKRVSARAAWLFTGAAALTAAVLALPSVLLDPGAAIEHVVRFPAGLTGVESPAASPLPGYLVAQAGDAGRLAAIAALGLAAIAVLVWVVVRPPRDAGDAALRAAAGLVMAMLLMPATRYGYLVYPLVLLGAAIAIRGAGKPVEPALDR